MEQLAHDYAKKISTSLNYTSDQEAVIAYGLTAIFQMSTIALIITFCGLCFGFAYESIIIFLGVGLLRKATGGAHSKTLYGCLIISCLNITFLALLSRYIFFFNIQPWYYALVHTILFILCFVVIYKKAPVDSPNKPIKTASKIKRLRKQSFITVFIYYCILLLCLVLSRNNSRFISIANSICLLTLWQTFTLTQCGAAFIHKIDKNFSMK